MNYTKTVFLKNSLACAFLVYAALLFLPLAQANDLSGTSKQVVTQLIEAMDANDAEKIRSLFSADATQEYERWWSRKKKGDKFREWLESDIVSVHGRVNNPEIKASGQEVVVTGTYENNDDYSSPANFLLTVENERITSWTMRYD